jgi:preprotein translocase SecE subunit
MARQTRQQRRARRAQQQPALAGGSPPPAPPAVRPVASGDSRPEPRKPDPSRKEERHAPGSRFVRFVQEAWSELKKVEWPSQRGVVSGTVVVIVACIVVGTFLYVNDMIWKYVVQHVLLK